VVARPIEYERNLRQVREQSMRKKLKANAIYKILSKTYPNVRCELDIRTLINYWSQLFYLPNAPIKE
jgi:U3 small nucleolar RNA-associated protein 14